MAYGINEAKKHYTEYSGELKIERSRFYHLLVGGWLAEKEGDKVKCSTYYNQSLSFCRNELETKFLKKKIEEMMV